MRRQYRDNDCGPNALINAYFYLYNHYPKISTSKLMLECNTNEEIGTEPYFIENNSLIKLDKPIFNKEKILKLKSFILLYRIQNQEVSHYVFVEQKNLEGNMMYYVYNYFDIIDYEFCHVFFPKEDFEEEFLIKGAGFFDDHYSPMAWQI